MTTGKKRWIFILTMILVLAFVFSACSGSTTSPTTPAKTSVPPQTSVPVPVTTSTPAQSSTAVKPILIRLSTDQPPADVFSSILKEMETIVPKETNGRATFEFYPAGTLYNGQDTVMALKSGTVQMCINGAALAFIIPELDAIKNVFFLFNDRDHMARFFKTDAYKNLSARMTSQGIMPLTELYPEADVDLFTSKKAVLKLEDFKGLKMSVAPSPLSTKLWSALGANPVPIPLPELSNSLETGMVEGLASQWNGMGTLDLPRLTPYCTLVKMTNFLKGVAVSTQWWSTVPPDLQQTLTKLFTDAMDRYKTKSIAAQEAFINKYKTTAGTQINEMSAAEKARCIDAIKPVTDELMKDANVRSIIDAANATR